MLDTRVYRAAFAPVVIALLVAAFALGERPRPIGTTLAPDAFDGRRAFSTLTELSRTYPRTRPGSPGDDALAERVTRDLRAAGFTMRTSSITADTVDGDRALATVVGERTGLLDRRIVVVTQRDSPYEDDAARMSATAALLELARLYRGRPTRRTLTFVSTSGATGGLAGVRDAVDRLGGPVDAVLVLGDLAGRAERRPFVVPYAEAGGMAPLRLRRTVEEAVRAETDLDPGSPRALVQLARLAVPLTLSGQGPFGKAGLSAVTIQASGERGPAPGTVVSRRRLQAFGRGTLRAISTLDNGPDVPAGPREYLVVQRRVLPRWAVQVIAGLLLLPALLGAVDGLARVRRRKRPVAVWLRWLAAGAVPFLLTAVFARLLGLTGLVPALTGPVLPDALPVRGAALVAVVLVLVLGFIARPRVLEMLGVRAGPGPDAVAGASAAVALTITLLAVLVWAFNPYTALLLIPAVHLWLLAAVPEVRLRRPLLVALVVLGLVPFALVGIYYATQVTLGPIEATWSAVLLLAGGTVGPLGALVWSGILACGLGALLVALAKRPAEEDPPGSEVSIRGPLTYAGPGSLGGTESAIRR
jgi:hypothetical protein